MVWFVRPVGRDPRGPLRDITDMRILSYNIQKGFGGRDRRYNFERTIATIEHENPDIICLQEVDHNERRSHYDDQPKILEEYFRFRASDYQFNHKVHAGGYGNMLLSRFPFHSVSQVCLKLMHRKKRGAQVVIVDTPEGQLLLVAWHLGLREKQRHQQVSYLLDHVDMQSKLHLPSLIIGDFNDWRNTLANGPFAQHGFEQITRPPSRFRTFPAYLPIGSLDKAFYRGPILIKDARVVRNHLTREASDHLPILLDFHIENESSPPE
jgi:endonuclease/exonuclease/phosphatase family metal-dependent hydrolase